jgi:hypothetical protein
VSMTEMVKSESGELTDQQAAEEKQHREAIIMKWLLTAVGVVMLLGTSIYSIAIGHQIASIGQIVGGLAVLIFANLDRIAKFKVSGTGVEAEMYKVRAVTEQAKSAITELQALGVLVAKLSLSLVKRQGRYGRYSDVQQDDIREDVIRVLDKLGVNERKIQDALSEWHEWVEFDYAYAILGGDAMPENVLQARDESYALLIDGVARRPTPEVLRSFLANHNVLSPEREQYIEDYEYYRINRIHRRPDAWRNRGQLGQLLVQPYNGHTQQVRPEG